MIGRKIAILAAMTLVACTNICTAESMEKNNNLSQQIQIQSKQMPADAKLRLAQRVQRQRTQQIADKAPVPDKKIEAKPLNTVNPKGNPSIFPKNQKNVNKFNPSASKPTVSKGRVVMRLVHPDGSLVSEAEQAKLKKGKKNKHNNIEERAFYMDVMLPRDYKEIGIRGNSELSKVAAANYIRQNNPSVKLACSVDKLVDYYWQEAEKEGVRGDIALCQAITETGFFKYGGDVVHSQNNFCGLGTTGGGVRGASFKTPQIGVRAHIQHLLAYSRKEKPKTSIVDPRYDLAHNLRVNKGLIDKWYGLNGTWAMGAEYCEKIMYHYARMGKAQNNYSYVSKSGKKPTMRERVAKYRKK